MQVTLNMDMDLYTAAHPSAGCTGYLKHKRKREGEAVEDAMHAGLVTAQQVRKRRQSQQAAGGRKDLGLREDGGAFKNGVMRVRPEAKAQPRGKGKDGSGRRGKQGPKRRRPQQPMLA